MSDRPMRLKYLTKMKIILCIFLLYITAVSVFGEPQELNGILGESVKFPAAVKIDGILRYSSVPIGAVTNGRFTPPRNGGYSGRLQWDSSTGLFSLSELRLEDSGVYTVQDTYQNINTIFQLNVYKDNVPVSKPHVSITHNEYPCTIECTAERGTGVTLSWYREDEKKPYVSSRVASAPYLHLPETVERSGTYTCEVKNSVSNEKASITVEAHCTAGPSAGTVVAIIIAVVAVLIAVVLAFLSCRAKTEIQDAVRRVILDADNQGLIKDAVRRIRLDEDNQRLLQDDEDRQALLQDVVRRIIRDEDRQALLQDVVRRTIQVQDILDKVDARTLLKKFLDNIVASTSDEQALLQDVKKLLDNIVASTSDEDRQALLQDVKKLLDNIVASPSAVRRVILDEDRQAFIHDAFRRLILVQDILDKVDARALQLRGPAKGNEKPETEKGDPPQTDHMSHIIVRPILPDSPDDL